MKKILSLLFLLPIFAAGQDFGSFTEIFSIPTNSTYLAQTGTTAGLRFTRRVSHSTLASNLFFNAQLASFNGWLWITNGRIVVVTNGLNGQAITYSNGVPQWIEFPGGSGEANLLGDAGLTNATRISQAGGKSGVTLLVKTESAGNGIVNTNEGGTNLVTAIDPAVVPTHAQLTTASNYILQLATIYTNTIYLNATGATAILNGQNFTNAVKNAPQGSLVVLGPGDWVTLTNSNPSVMMSKDNVSTLWMPGARWFSGVSNAAAEEAYMWDDQAGKRTNVNVYGWGQFFCSNLVANPILLGSGSKMFFEYQAGDAENSIFTFANGNNDLTMTCRGEMHSEGYDSFYFAPSQTNRLNLRAGKIRSAHGDIFEFTDDALEWGQVVVEADILERSGTGAGNPSFMQPSGRTIVRAKVIINRDPAASIYMNGSALTNALIEGAIIQHPDNATTSILQDTSIGGVGHTGLWLKNCVLFGSTNRDAFTLTNRAFLPTRFDNCTVFNGWAATNWVRGKTPSAIVVSGLVIEGPSAVGANITFTRTNTFAGLRNYGTFVNDGVLSSTGLVTAAGGLAVTGDANVTGNITGVNIGASGFISADTYIEALRGYQFPYLPATSLLMLEANKTATNTTLSSDFSLSGTTLSLATNAITSRTEDQTPATNDFLLAVDTSAAGFKKVAIGNLPGTAASGGPSTNYPPYTVPITGTNFVLDWLALGPTNTVLLTNYANAGIIHSNIVNSKERLVCILRQGSQGFCTIVSNSPNIRFTQVQTGITQSTNSNFNDFIVWVPDGNTNAVLSGQNWGAAP